MSYEASIDALTIQTSALLDVCTTLKSGVAQNISDAVLVSTNAAIIPLMQMAQNLIDTQTLLVTLITRQT